MGIIQRLIYRQAVKASAKQVVTNARTTYPTLSNTELCKLLHARPLPGLGPQAAADFAAAIYLQIYK